MLLGQLVLGTGFPEVGLLKERPDLPSRGRAPYFGPGRCGLRCCLESAYMTRLFLVLVCVILSSGGKDIDMSACGWLSKLWSPFGSPKC